MVNDGFGSCICWNLSWNLVRILNQWVFVHPWGDWFEMWTRNLNLKHVRKLSQWKILRMKVTWMKMLAMKVGNGCDGEVEESDLNVFEPDIGMATTSHRDGTYQDWVVNQQRIWSLSVSIDPSAFWGTQRLKGAYVRYLYHHILAISACRRAVGLRVGQEKTLARTRKTMIGSLWQPKLASTFFRRDSRIF